ncbi:hypothetical protein XccvBFoX1_gp44 [Xanthomonas phage FoX1]|uniref:Uncharacterized protein n=1 Tax=Xanthomonas phage FoX1 TaxID=2723897 RepID=A0A858NQ36_9CAUD|nr:hypothetical protein KNU93_gp66 [Xanthomonas phage FoX1]QJB21783.1 hypothetical protein XccvBFoX1_gp44 [Xanthomonas phage FoX1]
MKISNQIALASVSTLATIIVLGLVVKQHQSTAKATPAPAVITVMPPPAPARFEGDPNQAELLVIAAAFPNYHDNAVQQMLLPDIRHSTYRNDGIACLREDASDSIAAVATINPIVAEQMAARMIQDRRCMWRQISTTVIYRGKRGELSTQVTFPMSGSALWVPSVFLGEEIK